MSPVDGRTDILTPPSITIRSTRPVDQASIDRLVARARVRSLATGAVIATDALISRELEPSIRFKPKEPLAEGWYVLEVDGLDAPFVWPEFGSFDVLGDGSARTRFRVGSAPWVYSIWACEKGDGRTSLQIQVSETVVVTQPIAEHVRIDSNLGPLDCESVPPTQYSGELVVLCNLCGVRSVRVTLTDAFASISSPELAAEGGSAEIEFALSELSYITSGCKEHRLELPL